ncbi:MAG: hypothetical protein Q8916_12005 [Bacteroidota bacterium]|nr:hypothetical protein [Bacteroidota bacterium]MDP4231115.1 hypothetical protein [Bacteroidota bacterium]MDP4235752.1 hypothetical protein [Bacteroidota bacterium]
MKKRILLLILFSLIIPHRASSQCSDAGVCSFHSNDNGIFRRSGIGVDYLNGYSGHGDDIRYENAKIAGYYWFTRKFNIGAMLPLNRQRGRLGTIQGIGDLLVVADYLVNDHPGDLTFQGEESVLTGTFEATSVQVGGKFATGSVDVSGLPLLYQNGLGSNDLLLGIIYSAAHPQRYDYDLFIAGLTLQIPFGIAGNRVDSLKRGADFLGRIGYQYPIINSFGLKGEILAIQRLWRSTLYQYEVTTSESSPDPIVSYSHKVNDDILQINFSASATYKVREDIFFETGFTVPLLDKKVNYDGLKRDYTLFASVNYHFK